MKTREDTASEYLLNTISKLFLSSVGSKNPSRSEAVCISSSFTNFGVCVYPLVLRVMLFSLKASYPFSAEHLVLVSFVLLLDFQHLLCQNARNILLSSYVCENLYFCHVLFWLSKSIIQSFVIKDIFQGRGA